MKHKKIGFALIIALIAAIPGEWARIKEWFEFLSPLRQWVLGVIVALFITLCIAVVIVPVVWDWIQYLS